MSDFHKRLKRAKRRGKLRTSDLARWFGRPYTTVDSWLKRGCEPSDIIPHLRLKKLERKVA
jgi:hypothetical protein